MWLNLDLILKMETLLQKEGLRFCRILGATSARNSSTMCRALKSTCTSFIFLAICAATLKSIGFTKTTIRWRFTSPNLTTYVRMNSANQNAMWRSGQRAK